MPFLKSLLNLLQYNFCCLCSVFFFFFWPQDMQEHSSQMRDGTSTPCIGRWCLNYWTARDVPDVIFKSQSYSSIFFLKKKLFVHLAVLGLPFCSRAFSSCGEWGLLCSWSGFSRCGAYARECGLNNCDAWAWLPSGMWDLSRQGIEPVLPALAGRFSTTGLPGKSYWIQLQFCNFNKELSAEMELPTEVHWSFIVIWLNCVGVG